MSVGNPKPNPDEEPVVRPPFPETLTKPEESKPCPSKPEPQSKKGELR